MAITSLPTPPSRQDPANFNIMADEFLGALPTFGAEANSLATDVNSKQVTASNAATTATTAATTATTKASEASTSAITANTKATEASNSATSASNSASTASTKASESSTSASTAVTAATTATTKANEASASAAQALLFATAQNKASSSTNVVPGLGSKTFTIEVNKAFVAGQYISITSSSNAANKMMGFITSYNTSTGVLIVNVDFAIGTAATDWSIGIAASGNINTPFVVVSSTIQSATAGVQYGLKNAAISTINLPTTPEPNDTVFVVVLNSRRDNILGRSGNLIGGFAEDVVIDNPNLPFAAKFIGGTTGWVLL